MPLFRKKPAIWFVLRPGRPGQDWKREGPYTRQTIAEMYAGGTLGGGALLWTNEKIFANPKKPNSARLVRIEKWSRFDELPDPTQNDLIALANQPAGAALPPGAPQLQSPHMPAQPAYGDDGADEAAPPPPPPPGGYPEQRQAYAPPPQQAYAPPPQAAPQYQPPAPQQQYAAPQHAPYPAPPSGAHPSYPLPAQGAQPPPPPGYPGAM